VHCNKTILQCSEAFWAVQPSLTLETQAHTKSRHEDFEKVLMKNFETQSADLSIG
jgi:hypothetical protein